ncbi:sensor histidine kinase [Chengkuizengella axinellae]|uniref:Oxygen sensor histidine kinase NreB n=1 Tax=Chengkuizengella axinellae TaxID=3064388 RepID=A0ABT9IYF4_9BACL|nr:histidine kinase [Chengkuizengella sp. 2205SS18-9]MDP5274388.1 histidine kinase [Chengkuizengella sp. 2205SS18-9]
MYQKLNPPLHDKLNFSNSEGLKSNYGTERILIVYRYLSLFFTSIFYLIGTPKSPMLLKLGVIISLSIAALMITKLLLLYQDNKPFIRSMVLIESFGIVLILIPTQGVESSFIWYALNPVMVAASYLSPLFCWFTLMMYMCASTLITFNFFNSLGLKITNLIIENSYLYLVLILSTIAVQLFSNFTRELHDQAILLKKQRQKLIFTNQKLQKANQKTNEAIKHVMSLYQIVESFTSQKNLNNFLKVVTDYTVKLTKTPCSFIITKQIDTEEFSFEIRGNESKKYKGQIQIIHEIQSNWNKHQKNTNMVEVTLLKRKFSIISIQSSKHEVLIGIENQNIVHDDLTPYQRELVFLSKLCKVVLERIHLEEVTYQLLISGEQNRIANEIHDNISQRLFSIVYALHALSKNLDKMSTEQIKKDFQFIIQSTNEANKELRSTIYNLSSKKRGENLFEAKIKTYLEALEKLNHIEVDYHFFGDEQTIPVYIKNIIYRLICESTGNATRHGLCSKLGVYIHINQQIYIEIKDNGKGFKIIGNHSNKNAGIGIYNMKSLVHSLGGTIDFQSQINQGTQIQITIPQIQKLINQEVSGE